MQLAASEKSEACGAAGKRAGVIESDEPCRVEGFSRTAPLGRAYEKAGYRGGEESSRPEIARNRHPSVIELLTAIFRLHDCTGKVRGFVELPAAWGLAPVTCSLKMPRGARAFARCAFPALSGRRALRVTRALEHSKGGCAVTDR